MELPRTIPLFPLPNVVLFPGLPLPLHIFEPRYREMVRDAAASHEVIGMVLLRSDGSASAEAGPPPVFAVGCAGKIVSREPLPDGRSNILLHGVCEFRIAAEIPGRAYRRAEVEWLWRDHASLDPGRRERLAATLRRHLQAEPESPAHKVLGDASIADEVFVNFFSYVLDFPPLEKQALLEEPTLAARADRLREIVEFHSAAGFAAGDSDAGDRFH